MGKTRATFISLLPLPFSSSSSRRQWSLTHGGGVVPYGCIPYAKRRVHRSGKRRSAALSFLAGVEDDIRRSSRKLDTSSISRRRTTDRNWTRRPVPRALASSARSSAYNYSAFPFISLFILALLVLDIPLIMREGQYNR